MRIAVIGVGAVGGVLAGELAKAGHDVIAVCRGRRAEAIRTDGLSYRDLRGTLSVHSLPVVDLGERMPPCDLAILAMKAHHTAEIARRLVRFVGDTPILIVQNGLPWWFLDAITGFREKYVPGDPAGHLRLLSARKVGGVVRFGATLEEAGEVRATGPGGITLSATGTSDPIVADVAEVFSRTSLPVNVAEAAPTIWGKLVVNVPLNALAVMTGATISELLSSRTLRPLLVGLAGDIATLARQFGTEVAFDFERQAGITVLGQKSSTLQDVEAGRAIEYEALFGAPLWLAERVGLHLPLLKSTSMLVGSSANFAQTAASVRA